MSVNTIAKLTMAMITALGLSACTGAAVSGSYGYDPYGGGLAPYAYGYEPYTYANPGLGGFAVFGDFGHHHDHFRDHRGEFHPQFAAHPHGPPAGFEHHEAVAHPPPARPPMQHFGSLLHSPGPHS